MPSPEVDLRRVTKRIAELQEQQRTLIAQLDLDQADEAVILTTLELANEANVFVDQVKGQPTVKQQRKAINLTRKLSRAYIRLDKLPESAAKTAAETAHAEARTRLLSRVFKA